MSGGRKRVPLVVLLVLLGACNDAPVPLATATTYRAPRAEKAETARIADTVSDPGLLSSDVWSFVNNIDGYPLDVNWKTPATAILSPGKHLIEVFCVYTADSSGANAHLEFVAEAGHDYEVRCEDLDDPNGDPTALIRDLGSGQIVTQGTARFWRRGEKLPVHGII